MGILLIHSVLSIQEVLPWYYMADEWPKFNLISLSPYLHRYANINIFSICINSPSKNHQYLSMILTWRSLNGTGQSALVRSLNVWYVNNFPSLFFDPFTKCHMLLIHLVYGSDSHPTFELIWGYRAKYIFHIFTYLYYNIM